MTLGILCVSKPPFITRTYGSVWYPYLSILIAYGIYSCANLMRKNLRTVFYALFIGMHIASSIFLFVWISSHGRPTINNPVLHERIWMRDILQAQSCVGQLAVLTRQKPRGFPESWVPFKPNVSNNCPRKCAIYVKEMDTADDKNRDFLLAASPSFYEKRGRVEVICTDDAKRMLPGWRFE